MGDICCCQRNNDEIDIHHAIHHDKNAKVKIVKIIEVVNSSCTIKEKLRHLDKIFEGG